MTPLEQLLPALYRTTPQDAELQRVLLNAVAQAEADKDLTIAQLFPSTASGWGLELWERAWGIPVDRTQSEERRRTRVLAKVKGTGTTTVEMIQGMAEAYWPDCLVEELYQAYLLRIIIVMCGDVVGHVPYLEDFWASINELKPAHLAAELAWMTLSSVVIRTAWGYVLYSARRCGTWPQAATRGGVTRELVIVETGDGQAAYTAPATGEAVTGTWPQTATRGGVARELVVVETADGQAAYIAPAAGKAVTGTHPQAATQGGRAGAVVVVEGLDGRAVYAAPATGEDATGTHPQAAARGGQAGAVVAVVGLDGQTVYAAPAAGIHPQTAARGGAAEGGLTFTEAAGSAGVSARPCGSPPGAL